MTKEEEKKRNMLMQRKDGGLVKLRDVALILHVSLASCNRYKSLGIIDPYTTDGPAGLYILDEIKWVNERRNQLKGAHALRDQGKIIDSERAEWRSRHGKVYDPVKDLIS